MANKSLVSEELGKVVKSVNEEKYYSKEEKDGKIVKETVNKSVVMNLSTYSRAIEWSFFVCNNTKLQFLYKLRYLYLSYKDGSLRPLSVLPDYF